MDSMTIDPNQPADQNTNLPTANVGEASERMVPQSKVDEIIKTVKLKARDEIEEYKRQSHSQSAPPAQVQQYQSSSSPYLDTGNLQKLVEDHVTKTLSGMAAQHQQTMLDQEGQRMFDEFKRRIETSSEKYPGLWKNAESAGLNNFAHVVAGALQHDNTADIMYELIETNPLKMVGLQSLYEKSPAKAVQMMQDLANSIKINKAAQNIERPQEPLSKIETSNAGIQDDGNRTVQDWQRYLLKRNKRP